MTPTLETNEVIGAVSTTGSTVWFSFTTATTWNPADGGVELSTVLSHTNFDTTMDVFSVVANAPLPLTVASLTWMAGNDDCPFDPYHLVQSCVLLSGSLFNPNTTYYIRVGGKAAAQGVFALSFYRLSGV